MPLGVSAYWFAGATLTGTILTSVQTVGSAGVAITQQRAGGCLVLSAEFLSAATYSCRFWARSLAAFRMWNRYCR